MQEHDAKYYVQKAEEYQSKAKVATDPRVRDALEAAARQFMRKAREHDPKLPSMSDFE